MTPLRLAEMVLRIFAATVCLETRPLYTYFRPQSLYNPFEDVFVK